MGEIEKEDGMTERRARADCGCMYDTPELVVCSGCNRRKYISCTIDNLDLRGCIIASED